MSGIRPGPSRVPPAFWAVPWNATVLTLTLTGWLTVRCRTVESSITPFWVTRITSPETMSGVVSCQQTPVTAAPTALTSTRVFGPTLTGVTDWEVAIRTPPRNT